MKEKYTVAADLHNHWSLAGPSQSSKAPLLRTIVETCLLNKIKIAAISACHPKPGDIDTRFHDYVKQLPSLRSDFYEDLDTKTGVIHLSRKREEPNNFVYILYSQEVRTDYNGMPADINILGVMDTIQPGLDIEDTINSAVNIGGFALACHPNSPCGCGINKAIGLYNRGKFVGIEEFDASVNRKINQELRKELHEKGIKGIAVVDGHHISQKGAYTLFPASRFSDSGLSVLDLAKLIADGEFENHEEQIPRWSVHLRHTLPIVASIPGHLLSNPSYIIKALTGRK
jgi:hypothetical protein